MSWHISFIFIKASRILLRGDHFERSEMIEAEDQCNDDSLYERYLAQVDSVFASDCMKGILMC